MPLPKLDVPTYELDLISLDKKITYRPFLVKEEKILMIAMEGEDQKEVVNAMKQVISNCIIDEINVESLPLFELEHILLNLRSKSVGEKTTISITCQNCEKPIPLSIDLNKVKVKQDKSHTKEIQITESIGIMMKYPKLDLMLDEELLADSNKIFDIIEECVDFIWDEDETYKMEDYTKEDKTEFFESLSQMQFDNIREFFDTIPKLSLDVNYTCTSCKHKAKTVLEGMANFFG